MRAKGKLSELENLLQGLESFCYYDQESGDFIATRTRQGSHLQPGDSILNRDVEGYARVHFWGTTYKAHNLAWLWMTGDWPQFQIDHVDRNNYNNSWTNLRDVSVSQNHYNKGLQRNNKTGVKGVVWHTRKNKWMATIQVSGQKIHLGYFHNFDCAVEARKEAEKHYVI